MVRVPSSRAMGEQAAFVKVPEALDLSLLGGRPVAFTEGRAEAQVKKFVDYGHTLDYLASFYSINGFSDEQNQGWTAEFDFGSREAAAVRSNAAESPLDAQHDANIRIFRIPHHREHHNRRQ
jgi:hypothetical protein